MSDTTPITIKKYANRRLYNTGTSAYVTLEDLAGMVKKGENFVVYDAKSGDDITRSVLAQIIFEQEAKGGQSLLPITFLRQLISFYGDSMQMLVPSYLEMSLDKFSKERKGFSDQYLAALGNTPLANAARPMLNQIEEQTRKNMEMFRQALSAFTPFSARGAGTRPEPPAPAEPAEAPKSKQGQEEFDDMRRQLEDLQRRMEDLAQR